MKTILLLLSILGLSIKLSAQYVESEIDKVSELLTFSLIIDGGIRDLGAQTTNNQAATGVLGAKFDNDLFEISGSWIIGSNITEISEQSDGYGKALLNPNVGTPELGFRAELIRRFIFLKDGYGKFLLDRNRYQQQIPDDKYKEQLDHYSQSEPNFLKEHLGFQINLNANQTTWSTRDSLDNLLSENIGILSYGVNLIMTHYLF